MRLSGKPAEGGHQPPEMKSKMQHRGEEADASSFYTATHMAWCPPKGRWCSAGWGRDLRAAHKPVTPVSWAPGPILGLSESVCPRRHQRAHSCPLPCPSWRNLTNRMVSDRLRTKKAMQTAKKTPEERSGAGGVSGSVGTLLPLT